MTAPLDCEAIRQKAQVVLASRGITHDQASHILARHLLDTISALDAADAEVASLGTQVDELHTISLDVMHERDDARAEIAALKEERKTTFEYLVPLHSLAAQFATPETLGNSVPLWGANEIKTLRAENERLTGILRAIAYDNQDAAVRSSAGTLIGLARAALQPPAPSAPGETT